MKVLQISTTALPVPPVQYGGMEMVTYDLAWALNELGVEVGVACPFESKLPEGVEHIPTVPAGKQTENVAFMRYVSVLRNWEVVHDNSHWKVFYHAFKKNEFSWKYLSTLHNPHFTQFYPVAFLNVVCPTDSLSRYVYALYRIPSQTIFHGLEVAKYQWNKKRNDRFLFVGRPMKEKGCLEAIEFCKELDVPIDVVTGRLERNPPLYAIKVAQACTYGSKWKYQGAISHEKKIELFTNAKALLFPLHWQEPFGLIVIEAFASGCPVIAYKEAGMPELIDHGKTGFIAEDEEEFKEYMEKVDDLDPAEIRAIAEEKWDRLVMAKNYLKLYEEVLKGARW